MRRAITLFVTLAFMLWSGRADAEVHYIEWRVIVPRASLNDEALRVGMDALKNTGRELGLAFVVTDDGSDVGPRTIVVGDAERNRRTASLVRSGKLVLKNVNDLEGYEIRTIPLDDGMSLVVAGGSIRGDVHGLYWIRDRLRVAKRMPEINVTRKPALPIRYTRIPMRSKSDLRRALRYGLNLVYGDNPLNLIPWNTEPEAAINQKNREKTKELAAYAHALHMKFLAFGTDFTYHPDLIQEFGATLSPCDPAFWNAVQAKYRRLLKAVPELDGVGTFTGDEQQYWGRYTTFDVMHDGADCDWNLEKRYRSFVRNVHQVVVGEFDKLLLHRTWTTSGHEQHAHPEVYVNTFTRDLPTRNLYLIPSFTRNDRWWHQDFNPTFNLTPHEMLVVFESMDYHAGGNVFPTFPGPYFQAGLQSVLGGSSSNLKGASLDLPGGDGWDTRNLTAYTVWRLTWNPHDDIERIAEDFASIHLGPKAASGMADLLMLSPIAYKYGLYIEPVTHGGFNSLPHIRVGQFIAEGFPEIDRGKLHIEFLRQIYLRCKPWINETNTDLDHGLDVARSMEQRYAKIRSSIADDQLATQVENTLRITRLLIQTNNLYVKTCFAYFAYRKDPTDRKRDVLRDRYEELTRTRKAFSESPGFRYQLFGVDRLLRNVKQALDDLAAAEGILANAPTTAQIRTMITAQQKRYRELLDQYADQVVKVLHWEARVDGRDLVKVHGDRLEIKHLRWDGMYKVDYEFVKPLPKKEVTVIVKDLDSRPIHPFVLEQPSAENNFTATIYLYDVPRGAGWCKFDLYYIPQPPEALGLTRPWGSGDGSPPTRRPKQNR